MEINLDSLNKEQKQAVTHGKGPLLIVAGAGTGKTTVITQRINWLIREKKLNPEEILALTFTEKAAGEMEERVDKALPYGFVDLWISTFHSFCERILKTHALDIGLPNDFKVLDQTQSWLLIKKNLDQFKLDYYRPLGNPTKFIHALVSHFSRCKDEEINLEDYLKYAEDLKLDLDNMEASGGKASRTSKKSKIKNQNDKSKSKNNHSTNSGLSPEAEQEIKRLNEVANAYHIYQRILLKNDSLDFGDLINYCLKLFKTRPNILKKYQDQFKYILVDEFQDTNWAQYELLKLLSKKNNNITVVGDDDQSIYKFRGASVSNILNFKKDFPKSKEVFLQENYRSPQNILNFAYDFIQLNNPDRLEIKLQSGDKKLSKKLRANIKTKGDVEYNFLDSLSQEAEWVADKIVDIKNKNKDCEWNDFAILVRANDSASDFIRSLESRRIPYQFLASRGLFYKPVILDIINYLRLLDDYRESPALYRILNMPVIDIDTAQIINMNYWARRKQWSLFEVLKNIKTVPQVSEKTISESEKTFQLIEKHTKLASENSVWEVIMDFLTDFGYLKYIDSLSPVDKLQEFDYLNQFRRKVSDFEKLFVDKKVSDFLTEFELELDSGEAGSLQWNPEHGLEAVNIMTMHAAKGLEYPYIFIPNLVDKRFPTIARSEPILIPNDLIKDILPEGDVHLQEERRLFYVAMTRAKQGLFLSGAADYGGLRVKKPSRFIKELKMFKEGEKNKPIDKKPDKPSRVKKQDKLEHNLPKVFSFSQIKSFQSCPLQYKYSYILKIPVKSKDTFSFGRSIHLTLQKFFELVKSRSDAKQGDLFSANNKQSMPTWEDMKKIYYEVWIDDWYKSKKDMAERKKKGEQALKEFFDEWLKSKIVPEFLEKGFKLQIKDYVVRGMIDRIDKLEKGVEIIDYKTGQGKDKLDAQTKEQLLIYHLAAEQALKSKVAKLTYYYVESGKVLSFQAKDEELDKMKETVAQAVEKIKDSNFAPTPSPMRCKYCDFNKICEFSQAK